MQPSRQACCVKWTLWPDTVCMDCLLPAGGSGDCRVAASPGYSLSPPLGPQLGAPPLAAPPGSASLGGWDGLLVPPCLRCHNLWHFLSCRRMHHKGNAPPVGLGMSCPRALAYKVLCFRAPIRHALPCPRCRHSTHSLPGVEVTTPLAPPALSCPHSKPLDGLVSLTPPAGWGQAAPLNHTQSFLLGPEDEDQPLVGVGGQVPPVPRKRPSHPHLPLHS